MVTLCIGINDYASPKIKDLSYAEPDATALAERLRTLYGYETVLLLGKDATRAAIGKKLREYKEQLGEKDVLIVYFAGHGQVIELPSHGRAGFLVPQDADLDLDDRGNLDAWAAEALEMRGLVDSLADMKAHHVLLIADACCSGFMTKRGAFESRKDLHLLLSEPSRVVLAATTERQAAAEDWKTGHGFFTGALLEQVARKEAASVTDLFVEIRKRVSHDAKEMLPQMAKVGDGDGEFVFIPLEVPEHDIQVALRGGLEHALKGVYERAMRRVAERTRLEDVLDVFNAVDYRFSTKPREREKVWQEKFERFEENAQISDELAMVALHYCYAKGLGTVDKDAEKAYRWAMRAYEVGHGAGKHALAHCYSEGLGVGRNKAAAESLLRDSAEFLLSRYSLHEEMLRELLSTPVGDKVPLNAKVALGADERTRLLADLQAAADGGVDAARSGLAYLSCYGIKGWCDLRLMSSLNDVSGIPTVGQNLILVAAVNNVLHFRLFDADGKMVVDTDEKNLTGQTRQIEDLRKELQRLWPPHPFTKVLFVGHRERVITAVTSIVGHTVNAIIEGRPKESLELLEAEAHHRGSVLAHHYLACIYRDGIPGVVKPDPQKLLLHARTAAEAGLARAKTSWPAYISPPPAWRGTTHRHASGPNSPTVKETPTRQSPCSRSISTAGEYLRTSRKPPNMPNGETRQAIAVPSSSEGSSTGTASTTPRIRTRPCPSSSAPRNWVR